MNRKEYRDAHAAEQKLFVKEHDVRTVEMLFLRGLLSRSAWHIEDPRFSLGGLSNLKSKIENKPGYMVTRTPEYQDIDLAVKLEDICYQARGEDIEAFYNDPQFKLLISRHAEGKARTSYRKRNCG